MRALLDTHTFLWWLDGDKKLVKAARDIIADERNQIFVSASSAWEIATKVRIGKLPGATAVASSLSQCIANQEFLPLDISVEHSQKAGLLPGPHRDPFDRMLIAQAQIENLPIVSNDKIFDSYKVERIWS